jgi:hypothetical protein
MVLLGNAAIFAVTLLMACGGDPGPDSRGQLRAETLSQVRADAGDTLMRHEVPRAEQRLDQFLARSLPTVAPREDMFDSLWTCLPDEPGTEFYWLGDFRILSSRLLGDTAVVAAEILLVAKQVEDPDREYGWTATRISQLDTLHWTLVRGVKSDEWQVCGVSHEGVDFTQAGTPESVQWTPPGTTRASVLSAVDSIQRLRNPSRGQVRSAP